KHPVVPDDWRAFCDRIRQSGGDCDIRPHSPLSAASIAELAEAMASAGDPIAQIDGRGVEFRGDLDLSSLVRCDGIDLGGAVVHGDVTIGAMPHGASLGRGIATMRSGLNLHGVEVHGDLRIVIEEVHGDLSVASPVDGSVTLL